VSKITWESQIELLTISEEKLHLAWADGRGYRTKGTDAEDILNDQIRHGYKAAVNISGMVPGKITFFPHLKHCHLC
jgi:hypothetical protein